jgi:hypothetical protein
MKFDSRLEVQAHPDLMFRVRMAPVGLDFSAEGALEIATGAIRAVLAEIPVSVTIPFMPPARRRVVAGSIGPFEVGVHPAQATIRAFGVRIAGVAGPEGLSGETHVEGKCRAEIDLTGETPGRILKAAVEGVFEE